MLFCIIGELESALRPRGGATITGTLRDRNCDEGIWSRGFSIGSGYTVLIFLRMKSLDEIIIATSC